MELYTVVLDPLPLKSETAYHNTERTFHNTELSFANRTDKPSKNVIPERIRQMRRMFEYGREARIEKARNFYRQAKFMEQYEDDMPWSGEFHCYYPTYQDMTTSQLRGYFSWRTRARRGEFQPLPTSAVYLYVYELLNGIGTSSPEQALERLQELIAGYLDTGIGDPRMYPNLRKWMMEYAIVQNLPEEWVRRYADPKWIEQDHSLEILANARNHSDSEVFLALCHMGGKKLVQSPVLRKHADQGRRLFSQAWRNACEQASFRGKDLFTACFGRQITRAWYPLSNVVYDWRDPSKDGVCSLNPCRSYQCRDGIWYVTAYERLSFDPYPLQGFLHETDLHLRRYFKTGANLKEQVQDRWAIPYIEQAIRNEQLEERKAARQRIHIDLSGLDQIREDALVTQDSLLVDTDEITAIGFKERPFEVGETLHFQTMFHRNETMEDPGQKLNKSDYRKVSELLENVHVEILRALLDEDRLKVESIIHDHHLIPSIVADSINDTLFDEIGDVVLLCEDGQLEVVPDYINDLKGILYSD